MQFNLRTGMKDEQIINELKGQTSGESRQQVRQILQPIEPNRAGSSRNHDFTWGILDTLLWWTSSIARRNRRTLKEAKAAGINKYYPQNKSLEIIADKQDEEGNVYTPDGKQKHGYAILKEFRISDFGTSKSTNERYYLIGVNEDEKYFVHSLDYECQQIAKKIEQSPEVKYDTPRGTMPKGYPNSGRGGLDEIIRLVNRVDQGFTKRAQGDLVMEFYDYEKPYSSIHFRDVTGKEYSCFANHIEHTFGRHIISTDGSVGDLAGSRSDEKFVVVEGTELTMQHPEHKTVTYKIPEGKIALIGFQRGTNNPGHGGSISSD